ncbi:MAG: hypothetical protein K1060chlam2_00401 [Chlamydiae bacterium]|nr:hypothetical protein [Chlamydiota bacterium]
MRKLCLHLATASALLLTGCASYQASALSALDPNCVREYPEAEGVSIGCKAYTKQECYDYLDRDVIAKGYQPILLTFQNKSDKHYIFSTDKISLPTIRAEDVAKQVHTSTVGRVTGYSLGGLIFWPLFIPAIVDGIKSSDANTALDIDFEDKAKEYFVILPGAFKKTLIFVPRAEFRPIFDVTLLEEESGLYKTIGMTAIH